MAGVPQQRLAERADRRMVPRSEMSLGVTLHRVGEAEVVPAAIANLSATGFLAELADSAAIPQYLDVDLPNAGRRKAQVVWHSGAMLGCNFTTPLSRADISAARLKSDHTEPAAVPSLPPLDRSDPAWDVANVALPEERWPLPARVAVIAAAAILPWLSLAGIVAAVA